MKVKIKIIPIFAASAFLMNFFWESVHAVYLYEGLAKLSSLECTRLILHASIEDMTILIAIFTGASLLWRDISWVKKWTNWKSAYVLATTLGIASFIETRAIFFENRWSYTDLMPTIFGIGLSPLLQLLATFCLSILLLRQLKK